MYQSVITTQLLLVLLASCSARSAVPKESDKMTTSDSMEIDEVKKINLVNILSGIFDWTSPESNEPVVSSEEPELPYRPQRSMYNTHAGREKGMCKNFFWKTFSTC
ncbi:cortistatin [Mixophyes fleayi]|uniref:cortistatin n=1 Tax=Mixophyes fleayi TaxID=3061075 RepID=UPI003F4DC881